jgi:hypothetical protein
MYLRHDTHRFSAGDSLFCLTVQQTGHGRLLQEGTRRELVPDPLSIVDLCREYDFACPRQVETGRRPCRIT